jgi:hypothetical protein
MDLGGNVTVKILELAVPMSGSEKKERRPRKISTMSPVENTKINSFFHFFHLPH